MFGSFLPSLGCLAAIKSTQVEGADIVMKSSVGANAVAGCWPTSGSNLPHAGFWPTYGWTTRQELVGRNVFTSGRGRHMLYADPGSPPVITSKATRRLSLQR